MGCSSSFPDEAEWLKPHSPAMEPQIQKEALGKTGWCNTEEANTYCVKSGDEMYRHKGNEGAGGGPVQCLKMCCVDSKGARTQNDDGQVTLCMPWAAVKEEGEVFNNTPHVVEGMERFFMLHWTTKGSETIIYTKEPRVPGLTAAEGIVVLDKSLGGQPVLYPWAKMDAGRTEGKANKPFTLSLCTGDGAWEPTIKGENMGGRFWKFCKVSGEGTGLLLPVASGGFSYQTDGAVALKVAQGADNLLHIAMSLVVNHNIIGPTFKLPGQ